MKYRITITAVEDNPNFSAEMKEYSERSRYTGYGEIGMMPASEREVKKLETVLTEAEFNAAKAAILGCM